MRNVRESAGPSSARSATGKDCRSAMNAKAGEPWMARRAKNVAAAASYYVRRATVPAGLELGNVFDRMIGMRVRLGEK